jgi:antitoxin VapB
MREIRPIPWNLIDRLGDTPFMPEGRDQPDMPAGKMIFQPIDEQQRFDVARGVRGISGYSVHGGRSGSRHYCRRRKSRRRRIMTATAKLFMSGRSQAVRLPKEFRFEGTEVRVSKVGDKVILEPIEKQPIDFDKFWAELDALGARDFLPDGIPDDPPVEPDPRIFYDE